jgi:hypothetical protein
MTAISETAINMKKTEKPRTWTRLADGTFKVAPELCYHVFTTHALVATYHNVFTVKSIFLLAIMLSVLLRFTDSDHPFGIFIPFLLSYFCT